MFDKRCPVCDEVHPAHVVRTYDAGTYAGEYEAGGAEWQCANCGGKWTIRNENPGECFAFFPPDIDVAFHNDLQPFFAGA
jgi:transposase-like protein